MLSRQDIKTFRRNGYLLVPGILSPEQVESLRSVLRPLFSTPEARRFPEGGRTLVDIFNRHPETSWLPFHPPLVSAIKSILGDDFALLREVGAHLNFYAGAHKDTTSQERAGHTFHKQRDYLMLEAALYFQDNSEEHGGGLDVEPGSHKRPDPLTSNGGDDSFADRVRRRLRINQPTEYLSVPSKAGDLILFDFRINHRATPAKVKREKMAVFIACSRNNRHVKSYHRFIESRTDGYDYLKDFRYTEGVIEQATQAGVALP